MTRVKSLDGFRWVAILAIALSHMGFLSRYQGYGNFWESFLNNRVFGVDYFFVLSGYGLYSKYREKEYSGSRIMFAIERVKKIYPFYVFMLVVALPYSIMMDLTDCSLAKASVKAALKFTGCLTLFQSALGTTYLSHALIATSWFLSTLFICYFFCPSLIKLVKRVKVKHLIVAMIAVQLVAFGVGILLWRIEHMVNALGFLYLNDLYYGSFFARIWYLLLGMIVADIYVSYPGISISNLKTNLMLVIALVWFFARQHVSFGEEYRRFFDLTVVIIIMFALIYGQGSVKRFLEDYASKSSRLVMYVFLAHLPIIWYVCYAWDKLGLDGTFCNAGGIIQLLLIGIIVATVVALVDMFFARKM